MPSSQSPIAVFDSGLGGLTVVRALRRLMPAEPIVYFGDTARVPYGIKSGATVRRFALELCRYLERFEPKLFVVACNTASAAALPGLEEEVSVPVLGVIDPGASAAVEQARRSGRDNVLVLATEGTVQSGAYVRRILELAPELRVVQRACPLFVPMVEEGRESTDPLVRMAVRQYVGPLLAGERAFGACVLGCTHYPLLRGAIETTLGGSVRLVCSADETARRVQDLLDARGMRARGLSDDGARLECLVSDNAERFSLVGGKFLGEALGTVRWVSPEEYALPAVSVG